MQPRSKELVRITAVLGLCLACFLGATCAVAAEQIKEVAGTAPLGFVHVMDFGSKGNGNGLFGYIEDFDFTADGKNILVTCAKNATVQVFDKKTGIFLGKFGGKGKGDDKLVKPEGISVAPDGRIFVADYSTGYVKVYDKQFKWLKTFSSYGTDPGQNMKSEFTCIWGGKYFMADAGNCRVNVWDLDGVFLYSYGSEGGLRGQLSSPQAVKVNSRGEFIVSDLGNNRIKILDERGNLLRMFGRIGRGPGGFNLPAGIAVDKYDNIYVTEIKGNRIQVFDRTGKFITMLVGKGSERGQFGNLHGCIVDHETGWLYVADTANNRVQVYKPSSELALKLAEGSNIPLIITSDLHQPESK